MDGRLSGKVVIITGAGGGLGSAMVRCFLQEGARIVATDVASAGLEQFAGVEDVAAVSGDVTQRDSVEQMVATATTRFGGLDVLVNNAGIVDRFLPVAEMTDEVWQRVLAVNLTGPMMMSRAAIPAMLDRGGGCIVNISSVAGLGGAKAGAAYTASKHGLIGLTRNIAATYAREGIRCVAICPGGIKTGISIGGEPSVRGQEALNRAAATAVRTAEPAEIATLCALLASDEAGIVNGAVLAADAGWTAF